MSFIYIHDQTSDRIVPIFTAAATVIELKQQIQENVGLTDDQMAAVKIIYSGQELKDHYECVRYTWASMDPPAILYISY